MEFTLNRRNFLGAGTGLAVNATLAAASGGGARAEAVVDPEVLKLYAAFKRGVYGV